MPTLSSSLPLLSEHELLNHFGDDQTARRRYQLLHAVLIMGMTQREAADANAVSERTVRNVLRSYASGKGLEALHSRRTRLRNRHRPQTSAAEQALAEALADEPEAGGDRLWRRAQERLGSAGAILSRRTAYRILAQLRAENDDDDVPNSLRSLIRTALPLLPEDPPLALGASLLAQQVLPHESDPLSRGMLLQQALRTTLDRLRPPGAISTVDRSWWPYLICIGEYEAGQRRAELQDDLALSASTYSRAKRQGLDYITTLLPQIVAQMVEVPTRLVSQRLPRTPDFVGRYEEQSYYAWRLQTEGIAHVWGPPGSGKTALAAELAAEGYRYGQTILWHSCGAGPDATLIGIIRGLAKALASAGDELLWQELRHTLDEEHDPHALLDMLRDRLLVHPAVVVLDDFHRVESADMEALFDALADLIVRRSTRLLLVGRVRIDSARFPALRGLREREAQMLWAGTPAIPIEQWNALYDLTAGLPQPIRRAASAYRRAGDLARPEDCRDEAATWARDEIWELLDADEQCLLVAVHQLDPHALLQQTTRICEALDIGLATPQRLKRRGLLMISGEMVFTFGILRVCIEARLREDGDLRDLLQTLATDLEVTMPDVLDSPSNPVILEPDEAERTAAPMPAGLDLLNRVREALQTSAAYLQDQDGDQEAHQLAAELEVLQAALPDPSGPRAASARVVG
jgi:AAA ATPase domain/Homeodomain-like domain